MGKKTEEVAVAVERNPADPIGNPPGGGKWTWDIEQQQWVELPINADTEN